MEDRKVQLWVLHADGVWEMHGRYTSYWTASKTGRILRRQDTVLDTRLHREPR